MANPMRLEILHVPDCPGVALLAQRIAEALGDERIDHAITYRVVDDPAAAIESGMTGSPTLLIDGDDPFAARGLVPSLSCRLYRADRGVDRAPSVAQLRAALNDRRPGKESGQ
jgi:hypothetical protein